MSIKSASFEITKLNTDAYKVAVSFLDENKKKISESAALNFAQTQILMQGTNIDSFTKNATVRKSPGETLKNVFGKTIGEDVKIIEDAKMVLSEIKENTGNTQNILVADLNDSQANYANYPQILKGQNVVKEFLTSKKPTKFYEILKALKDLNIDFMISEGPIKYDLIRKGNMFSPDQLEFLLSKQGKGYHCQLAEFIMNGFKFGQIAKLDTDSSVLFEPNNYIFNIGDDHSKQFLPLDRSVVLLPPEYKQMYAGSEKAPYVKAIENIFTTTIISHTSSDMTTMILSKGE